MTEALGTPFYYRARGPLSALLRQPFLGSCVLRGSFSALALNAPTDQGNSFAIMPGGILNISLDRESFQASLVVVSLLLLRNYTYSSRHQTARRV